MKLDEVEHLCPGPECCDSDESCVTAFCDDIDEETSPAIWAEHRWLGSEEAVDWHLFWMSAFGIVSPDSSSVSARSQTWTRFSA